VKIKKSQLKKTLKEEIIKVILEAVYPYEEDKTLSNEEFIELLKKDLEGRLSTDVKYQIPDEEGEWFEKEGERKWSETAAGQKEAMGHIMSKLNHLKDSEAGELSVEELEDLFSFEDLFSQYASLSGLNIGNLQARMSKEQRKYFNSHGASQRAWPNQNKGNRGYYKWEFFKAPDLSGSPEKKFPGEKYKNKFFKSKTDEYHRFLSERERFNVIYKGWKIKEKELKNEIMAELEKEELLKEECGCQDHVHNSKKPRLFLRFKKEKKENLLDEVPALTAEEEKLKEL
jgi:hypothetical protein